MVLILEALRLQFERQKNTVDEISLGYGQKKLGDLGKVGQRVSLKR
jgi:hypothetical protein